VSVVKNVEAYSKELGNYWEELPPMLISSSHDGTGREEIISYIENINKS
jgi:GTP-binding protein